jgi:hypothetical protein
MDNASHRKNKLWPEKQMTRAVHCQPIGSSHHMDFRAHCQPRRWPNQKSTHEKHRAIHDQHRPWRAQLVTRPENDEPYTLPAQPTTSPGQLSPFLWRAQSMAKTAHEKTTPRPVTRVGLPSAVPPGGSTEGGPQRGAPGRSNGRGSGGFP